MTTIGGCGPSAAGTAGEGDEEERVPSSGLDAPLAVIIVNCVTVLDGSRDAIIIANGIFIDLPIYQDESKET